jgi:hypothetical protein
VQHAADFLALDYPSRGRRVQGALSRVAERSAFADPGPGTRSKGTGSYEEDRSKLGVTREQLEAPSASPVRGMNRQLTSYL